jgi:hypothetical protein
MVALEGLDFAAVGVFAYRSLVLIEIAENGRWLNLRSVDLNVQPELELDQ